MGKQGLRSRKEKQIEKEENSVKCIKGQKTWHFLCMGKIKFVKLYLYKLEQFYSLNNILIDKDIIMRPSSSQVDGEGVSCVRLPGKLLFPDRIRIFAYL